MVHPAPCLGRSKSDHGLVSNSPLTGTGATSLNTGTVSPLVPRKKTIKVWQLPNGRWAVDAGVVRGGRRGRTTCKTEQEARDKAAEYAKAIKMAEGAGERLTRHQREYAVEAIKILEDAGVAGREIVAAALAYVPLKKQRETKLSPKVEDVGTRLVDSWKKSTKNKGYIRNRGGIVREFGRHFKGRNVGSITRREMDTWIDLKKGSHSSLATRRSALSALMSQAASEDLIAVNPVTNLKNRMDPDSKKPVVYFKDTGMVAYMLDMARQESHPDILLSWLLQGFGATRGDEVDKPNGLQYEHIHLAPNSEDSYIEIPYGVAAKNGPARSIPISPNLHAWLTLLVPGRSGAIRQPSHSKREAALRVKMAPYIGEWNQWINSWRHSYGTYRLPMTPGMSYSILAMEMGNSPDVARKHYDGCLPGHNTKVKQANAAPYWAIGPANCRTIAEQWVKDWKPKEQPVD